MVPGLPTLTNGLPDIPITERTHVPVLSAFLGVLVGEELSTETADDTLPTVSLRNSDDVEEAALRVDIIDRQFVTESLLRPCELQRWSPPVSPISMTSGVFEGLPVTRRG